MIELPLLKVWFNILLAMSTSNEQKPLCEGQCLSWYRSTISAGLSKSLRKSDLSDPFLSVSVSPSGVTAMRLPDPERLQMAESAPSWQWGLVKWSWEQSCTAARGRFALLYVGELNLYPFPVRGSTASCLKQQMLATLCWLLSVSPLYHSLF